MLPAETKASALALGDQLAATTIGRLGLVARGASRLVAGADHVRRVDDLDVRPRRRHERAQTAASPDEQDTDAAPRPAAASALDDRLGGRVVAARGVDHRDVRRRAPPLRPARLVRRRSGALPARTMLQVGHQRSRSRSR